MNGNFKNQKIKKMDNQLKADATAQKTAFRGKKNNTATLSELQAMTYSQMDKADLLEYCKANFPALYQAKYDEKFAGAKEKFTGKRAAPVRAAKRTPFK